MDSNGFLAVCNGSLTGYVIPNGSSCLILFYPDGNHLPVKKALLGPGGGNHYTISHSMIEAIIVFSCWIVMLLFFSRTQTEERL